MSGGTGDADMYLKFGSAPTDSSYDCRPYANGNSETCNVAVAQAGTYYIRLKAYSSYTGVSLTGSYGSGGGSTTVYSNTTAIPVPDRGSATSTINVSGRSGNAPSTSKVSVNISHARRGDLRLTLIAPDGTIYLIKPANKNDIGQDLVATYNVNLSSEALNGNWRLKVDDQIRRVSGTLNSWSLEF
jgi:hypothetical protein